MAISIICTNKNPEPWVAALHEIDPSLDIQIAPNECNKDDIDFALCWKNPEGVLSEYPNLRCICSMGAGVDHLLTSPYFMREVPKGVPVVRLVDPLLKNDMFEYVSTAVMYYFRNFDHYQAQQRQGLWRQLPAKAMEKTTIGIMGLGQLGGYVADKLSKMGFNVIGWSRTEKTHLGITTYAGGKQLGEFLSQAEILICMLPLTDSTYGILNLDLFHTLPQNACVINVARGEHLIEDDLLTALKAGHVRGAFLDVFKEEPLPSNHPFWHESKIQITPHCSSVTDPRSVAPQIVRNYRNMQAGRPLLNCVDLERGY